MIDNSVGDRNLELVISFENKAGSLKSKSSFS